MTKQKQKTNIRSSTEDMTIRLVPPRKMSLEECLDFIIDDEIGEVTPVGIRMRERVLNADERNKLRKRSMAAEVSDVRRRATKGVSARRATGPRSR